MSFLSFLVLFIALNPLFASALIWLGSFLGEKGMSRIARGSVSLQAAAFLTLLGIWASPLLGGGSGVPVELNFGEVFRSGDYVFSLLSYIDHVSIIYLGMTTFLAGIIVLYSRIYMHREAGYRRFFATILFFVFGMNFLVLSGSLDMLFAGWEVVGISSYLLIGFYRHRLQPVRNALRVYSIYRLCDVGFLLGAWMSHLMWHVPPHFSHLSEPETAVTLAQAPWQMTLGLSLLILTAALGKSAQFPFSNWLPKAMEGPTPSSAIFYGALSVHAGVFLLHRTYPIWHATMAARGLVAFFGLLTAWVATGAGRTQSNIKGQIAYASITQVGLMFVELAAGLPVLALIHFVGNASLRCYQLLISPSVVAHLLRIQGSTDSHESKQTKYLSIERALPPRIKSTLYVFSLNEGYLDQLLYSVLWRPLRWVSGGIARLQSLTPLRILGLLLSLGLTFIAAVESEGSEGEGARVTWVMAGALLMLWNGLSGIGEKQKTTRVWDSVSLSCLMIATSVWLAHPEADQDVLLYLSGIIPAWALGRIVLAIFGRTDLTQYSALSEKKPVASFFLFLSVLCLAGFPISASFIGEDILIEHSVARFWWLAFMIVGVFVLNGISLIRLFSHTCFGKGETT